MPFNYDVLKQRRFNKSFFLQDGAAPVYAKLLEMAAERMGNCEEYYSLWPTRQVEQPWATLQEAVFTSVSSTPSIFRPWRMGNEIT